MNKPTKWILAGTGATVVLMVGVGIGASGSTDDQPPSSADLSAPTVTVTKTVTTPGPRMAPGTPQACLDALTAAEALTRDAGDFATTVTAYPDLIRRAALAGATGDTAAIQSITRKIESMSVEIRAETDSVNMHGARFRSTAADCRAGA